jgi:hypothetical protein
MKARCKQYDIFGQSIALNYKGRQTYQTTMGACLSLPILALLTIAFCIRGFHDWFQQNTLTSLSIAPPMYSDQQVTLAGDYPFEVQVGFADVDFNPTFISTQMQFTALDS